MSKHSYIIHMRNHSYVFGGYNNMKEKNVCDTRNPHSGVIQKLGECFPDDETVKGVSAFFKAMGDETRARILLALNESELCVCDLTEFLGMTQSAVSHQLSYLRRAQLVNARRAGKEVFYSVADDHVKMMLEAGIEHAKE